MKAFPLCFHIHAAGMSVYDPLTVVYSEKNIRRQHFSLLSSLVFVFYRMVKQIKGLRSNASWPDWSCVGSGTRSQNTRAVSAIKHEENLVSFVRVLSVCLSWLVVVAVTSYWLIWEDKCSSWLWCLTSVDSKKSVYESSTLFGPTFTATRLLCEVSANQRGVFVFRRGRVWIAARSVLSPIATASHCWRWAAGAEAAMTTGQFLQAPAASCCVLLPLSPKSLWKNLAFPRAVVSGLNLFFWYSAGSKNLIWVSEI